MGPKGFYTSKRITRQEQKILSLIAEGYRDDEIAEELSLDTETVGKCQASLMEKLELSDFSSVIEYAIQYGWIDPYEILKSRFSRPVR